MKTILAIVGTLALLVVIMFGALFFIGYQRVQPIFDEAQEFADTAIPAIAANWDGEELSSRAAPELADILQNGVLEELMTTASFQLGAMTSYSGASCQITRYEINTDNGEFVLAECLATGEFEKANASFRVDILKRNSEWKILGFYVTPELAGNQPVQVAYTTSTPRRMDKLEISIVRMSIGVSSMPVQRPGVSIGSHNKIENID